MDADKIDAQAFLKCSKRLGMEPMAKYAAELIYLKYFVW